MGYRGRAIQWLVVAVMGLTPCYTSAGGFHELDRCRGCWQSQTDKLAEAMSTASLAGLTREQSEVRNIPTNNAARGIVASSQEGSGAEAISKAAGVEASDTAGPSVRIKVKPAALRPGRLVRVEVWISDATDVTDAPFNLTYDPSILEYLSAREGPFLRSDQSPAVFLAHNDPQKGVVYVGLSRYSRTKGVNGGGLLVTLRFRANARGSSDLKFSHQAVRNGEGRFITASFIGSLIKVR